LRSLDGSQTRRSSLAPRLKPLIPRLLVRGALFRRHAQPVQSSLHHPAEGRKERRFKRARALLELRRVHSEDFGGAERFGAIVLGGRQFGFLPGSAPSTLT
jgi:hypothetical protein